MGLIKNYLLDNDGLDKDGTGPIVAAAFYSITLIVSLMGLKYIENHDKKIYAENSSKRAIFYGKEEATIFSIGKVWEKGDLTFIETQKGRTFSVPTDMVEIIDFNNSFETAEEIIISQMGKDYEISYIDAKELDTQAFISSEQGPSITYYK